MQLHCPPPPKPNGIVTIEKKHTVCNSYMYSFGWKNMKRVLTIQAV